MLFELSSSQVDRYNLKKPIMYITNKVCFKKLLLLAVKIWELKITFHRFFLITRFLLCLEVELWKIFRDRNTKTIFLSLSHLLDYHTARSIGKSIHYFHERFSLYLIKFILRQQFFIFSMHASKRFQARLFVKKSFARILISQRQDSKTFKKWR